MDVDPENGQGPITCARAAPGSRATAANPTAFRMVGS
jgi:hypothetical protein